MVGATNCPQCGTPFDANDSFCAKCGVRVTPPPPTWGGASATQAGIQLGDDEDLMLEKIRQSTVGEYEVRGVLGRGGMASVFVAYDLTLNRKVALKVMHPGLLGDAGMRERFRLEARMAARLDHPNIVTVHAVKERGTIVFFDLKLIDGTSLDRLLRNRTSPIPVRLARWVTAKIAEALHYAHTEGIVHRDMKPANVMVDRRGDCIVTDFGIAKATESPHLTMTGAVVGTPAYMSPEQCLGEEVTSASDQYSLGIMAYELLTGQVPYSGAMLQIQLGHVEKVPPAPHEVVPGVPPDVSNVVMRMLAKDPTDRWPTLAQAAEALIDGLGASDAQMRREMSQLIRELPEEVGRSLPQTPRSPTPITVTPTVGGTSPAVTATPPGATGASPPSVDGVPELLRQSAAAGSLPGMPTVSDAPGIADRPTEPIESPRDSVEAQPVSAPAATGGGRGPMIGIAAAVVGVAGLAYVLLRGGGEDPAAAQQAAQAERDSAAAVAASVAAAAEQARQDSLLDVADSTVARIGMNPLNVTLAVGDSARISAVAYSQAGEQLTTQLRWSWSSSDSAFARVNSRGWVYGVARTPATERVFITATAGDRSGVAVVVVR